MIDSARAQVSGLKDFEIWTENLPVLEVFLRLSSAWKWVSGGLGPAIRVGIPPSEIRSVMKLLAIKRKKRREILHGIQIMELAALEELSDE